MQTQHLDSNEINHLQYVTLHEALNKHSVFQLYKLIM